jgi:hypothetical protein
MFLIQNVGDFRVFNESVTRAQKVENQFKSEICQAENVRSRMAILSQNFYGDSS